jgi:hypothetical protein
VRLRNLDDGAQPGRLAAMRDDQRPGRAAPWREPLRQSLALGAGLLLPVGGTQERSPWRTDTPIRTPFAHPVGSVAAFWVVQRAVAFWG